MRLPGTRQRVPIRKRANTTTSRQGAGRSADMAVRMRVNARARRHQGLVRRARWAAQLFGGGESGPTAGLEIAAGVALARAGATSYTDGATRENGTTAIEAQWEALPQSFASVVPWFWLSQSLWPLCPCGDAVVTLWCWLKCVSEPDDSISPWRSPWTCTHTEPARDSDPQRTPTKVSSAATCRTKITGRWEIGVVQDRKRAATAPPANP